MSSKSNILHSTLGSVAFLATVLTRRKAAIHAAAPAFIGDPPLGDAPTDYTGVVSLATARDGAGHQNAALAPLDPGGAQSLGGNIFKFPDPSLK